MSKGHGPLTRAIDITLPRDTFVLLCRLVLQRVEADCRPADATRSAVVDEAIRVLAEQRGLLEEGP